MGKTRKDSQAEKKERKENGHKEPKMTPYDKRLYRGSR